jgi:diaminopimelate decarboxylase
MTMDRRTLSRLARAHGTPLYVYDAEAVTARFRALEDAFRTRAPLICYAMKANSNRAVVALLARQGAGADIVSGGELLRALAAGVPAERIVFSGVGKTKEEQELGIRKKVLTFNVESMPELDSLQEVARRLKRRAPISVRLNPDVDPKTHPHITTGLKHNKFGVDRAQALKIYAKAAASRWLAVKGVQCHIGSQITDTAPFEKAARELGDLVRELGRRRIAIELIDIGGGLGVTYKDEPPLPLAPLAAAVDRLLPRGPRLLLEPGRYLVAEAGVLVTRALYVKRGAAKTFVIVDAAMNDLARPALYDAYHPIEPLAPRRGTPSAVDVVGPVCESGDFLARDRRLPPVRAGDLLAVRGAGAYGFAMSSQYNSRPRAAEVLVDGSGARLIRARETLKDVVARER